MKTKTEILKKIKEQKKMQEGASAFQIMQLEGRIRILEWVLGLPEQN